MGQALSARWQGVSAERTRVSNGDWKGRVLALGGAGEPQSLRGTPRGSGRMKTEAEARGGESGGTQRRSLGSLAGLACVSWGWSWGWGDRVRA